MLSYRQRRREAVGRKTRDINFILFIKLHHSRRSAPRMYAAACAITGRPSSVASIASKPRVHPSGRRSAASLLCATGVAVPAERHAQPTWLGLRLG